MFPLRDVHRPARAPIITRLLVLLLVAAFAWQVWLATQGREDDLLRRWAARPRCVVEPWACGIDTSAISEQPGSTLLSWLAPLLSAAFLHAGIVHLAFNAWFLWVFGPAVEDRLGRFKYLVFYLACALAASAAHVAAQPHSSLPMVGASGAIAGVLGAHLILLPRSWILSYVPPIWVLPIPSLAFLALWAAAQAAEARALLPREWGGVASQASGEGGVAWAAHVGGFLFGVIWAWRARPWFRPKKREA